MWPAVVGSVRTGSDINDFFSSFMKLNSFTLKSPKVAGRSFQCLEISGVASRVMLWASVWITLHNTKKAWGWEMFVSAFNPFTAPVVHDSILRRPDGLRVLSNRSFCWEVDTICLGVTLALRRIVGTFRTLRFCFCCDWEKITMSCEFTRANCRLFLECMTSIVCRNVPGAFCILNSIWINR